MRDLSRVDASVVVVTNEAGVVSGSLRRLHRERDSGLLKSWADQADRRRADEQERGQSWTRSDAGSILRSIADTGGASLDNFIVCDRAKAEVGVAAFTSNYLNFVFVCDAARRTGVMLDAVAALAAHLSARVVPGGSRSSSAVLFLKRLGRRMGWEQ